jgi:Recombinase.
MPGPEEEIAWVNRMFRWLIDEDMSFREIADRLNEHGIATDLERPCLTVQHNPLRPCGNTDALAYFYTN